MPIPKDPTKAALWKKRQSKSQKGKSKNVGKDNPFYGKKHSKETKQMISNSVSGENNPLYGTKRPQYVKDAVSKAHRGRPSTFKGKKHSLESREKMSQSQVGNKNHLGNPHTEETKKRISEITRQRTPRGKNHPRWSGGCGRYARYYSTIGYKAWRKDVFERDFYTCQSCGDNQGGNLEAHHIVSFKGCIDNKNKLEFKISNGITLCKDCHKARHVKLV